MDNKFQEQQIESNTKAIAENAQKAATSVNLQFLEQLQKGDANKLLGNQQLNRLDKFAENMDVLADGKLNNPKPYSKIAQLPEDLRSDALQKTSENLRNNLMKVQENLAQNPTMYSKEQRSELDLIFKGIDMQGGVDKFMSQQYGLTGKKVDKDRGGLASRNNVSQYNELAKETGLPTTDELEKRSAAMKNRNFDFNKDAMVSVHEARYGVAMDADKDAIEDLSNKYNKGNSLLDTTIINKPFEKTATKNVEPIISGNQAQSMPSPQQGLNMQNR